MGLEKEPFRAYDVKEKESKDIFTIRLNEDERRTLDKCKSVLEQSKDGTALKTLAWIGANVIHEKNIGYLLAQIFKNKKNNQRTGVIEFE